MITPSSESTTTTTVSSSCIMNTAAAADHNNNSENRFSIANCAIESNNRTTTNKRVATHHCTDVDRQPILPSQQRTVRYVNHEHHITDQHRTSSLSLSIQTINSNKAEVQIRKEEEEEEEDFDKHNLLIGRRLHRIKRRLFLQLTVPSISSTMSTSNLLSSSSASACSCCSTTSLVLTVE